MSDLEEEIGRAEDRLHILDGLVRALEDPHALLDVLLGTDDAEGSREALRSAFGLSEIQSMAAMDLQLRRVSRHELQKIADARDEVAAQLARLRSSGRHG